MMRTLRVLVALTILAMFMVVPTAASASGGGGCGRPVTDTTGSAIGVRGFCFRPTILRVAPGAAVTFTNRDPLPHTVLGANGSWGSYDTLKRGRSLVYEFTESGVYPFVCTYHPGMIGAVVVGNGVGGAIDATTAAGPVIPIGSPPAELESVASVATTPVRETTPGRVEDGLDLWSTVGLGAFALLAACGALGIRRHRRRSLA